MEARVFYPVALRDAPAVDVAVVSALALQVFRKRVMRTVLAAALRGDAALAETTAEKLRKRYKDGDVEDRRDMYVAIPRAVGGANLGLKFRGNGDARATSCAVELKQRVTSARIPGSDAVPVFDKQQLLVAVGECPATAVARTMGAFPEVQRALVASDAASAVPRPFVGVTATGLGVPVVYLDKSRVNKKVELPMSSGGSTKMKIEVTLVAAQARLPGVGGPEPPLLPEDVGPLAFSGPWYVSVCIEGGAPAAVMQDVLQRMAQPLVAEANGELNEALVVAGPPLVASYPEFVTHVAEAAAAKAQQAAGDARL